VTIIVPIKEAEGQLAQLVNRAREGEEVLITVDGETIRLVPTHESAQAEQPKEWRRPLGLFKDRIIIRDDCFDPLPKEFWGVFE